MRKHLCLVAAAALAVSGFSFTSTWAEDAPAQNAPTTQPEASKLDTAAIRTVLTQVTDTAVKNNGFSELANFLQTKPGTDLPPNTTPPEPNAQKNDRGVSNTVGNGEVSTPFKGPTAFKDYTDLNQAAAQFRQDWKEKYHSDFDLNASNAETALNDQAITITIGSNEAGEARTASEKMSPNGDAMPNPQNMAVVHLETLSSGEANTLRMTNFGDAPIAWKICVPPGDNEKAIHDVLLQRLQTLDQKKADWPANETDAYRQVSEQILGGFAQLQSEHMNNGQNQNSNNGAPANQR